LIQSPSQCLNIYSVQYSFLMAARTEIPCFACYFERSDESSKVIISALRVSTAYPSYAFGIIATFNEFLYCSFYSHNPVFAVLFRVLGVIVFFKRFEMIMQYLLNDILFPWFIDEQTVLLKPGGCTHPLCLI